MADISSDIIVGDCIAGMNALPENSVDLVFADPPYNLQLRKTLSRPDQTRVLGVDHDWDRFEDLQAYDNFTKDWLIAALRVLKPNGALWVIGSYHNIYRVGALLQELDWWILNDVIWQKPNAMPNFRGTRLQNSTEILLWAVPGGKEAKYTFNYQALKDFNEDKQLNNVWEIPICGGGERLKDTDGATLHPTQKPEALLYRVLLASTNAGDTVLDPFCGTGTTGAVAKRMGRNFIGLEQDENYATAARARIAAIVPLDTTLLSMPSKKTQAKIPFGTLVAAGYMPAGTVLNGKAFIATVQADGSLVSDEQRGSIHQLGAKLQGLPACNGWDFWQHDGQSIDAIRQRYLKDVKAGILAEG